MRRCLVPIGAPGRLAALEGERRLVLEQLQRVEATVLTQAQAAAQAAVQEAQLRGVFGAMPTRMACMSPAERATLLRACVDEIVVQSDGMLTITGVLPAAEAIQPTVELSPGCRSRRRTGDRGPGGLLQVAAQVR